MNLTSATPVRQLRRQVSGCARYQLAKSAVLLLIALTLSLGFALPAQAQSDETPSISVHTPRSTVSIEEEIELSFRASSPVPGSVKVRIEITIRGPFIDESVVIERGPYQSDSAGEVIGWNVVPSAVREDYDYSGATFTATILPGDGYTVGSPSSVSVFVRGNEGQDSEQQSDDGSSAPGVSPTPDPVIGSTTASTATVLPGDRLELQRHDLPEDQPTATLDLGIGWVSMDGSQVILVGVIRDAHLGQTYIIVRHEGSNRVVRRWVPPNSPLVYAIDWTVVNTPVHRAHGGAPGRPPR